ncbi:leucyl aminopeptidase [Candidatus Magnetomonas plexicatena]|uniref:leucyl aminopeptidase n=1 Tax=Candidatus Magnetomonas plexicatena TaxID=2552947 RepID=UPI001C74A296|nr:leucyl aminopeptidase [Nitrospirales bacterium LBB_01]
MEIKIKDAYELDYKSDCLILPFFEPADMELCADIDAKTGGLIQKVITSGEFKAKEGQCVVLYVSGASFDRLLLVGLGKKQDVTAEKLRRAGSKAFVRARELKAEILTVSVRALNETEKSIGAFSPSYYFTEGALLGLYRYIKYKKVDEDEKEIKEAVLLSNEKDFPVQWLTVNTIASTFARDLVNSPSKDMTPTSLADVAKSLAGKNLKVKILEQKDSEKEGMWSYLAVAKGSDEPPKFIVLEYTGAGKSVPLAIVGKAITFDSGGLSLKPADSMEDMKQDMAGGAATLAIFKAVSSLKLPINLIGILPATENMPGGHAIRPGDVVTAITGKTIEILNTDAEGRLALVDAIGYVIKHYKPEAVIDMATLTGACSIALGNEAVAMMGNDDKIMAEIKDASDETFERVWQMPLFEEFKEYLKSEVADIKNIGGRTGGLITAAYFIKEFVGETPWVHLDIASTAFLAKPKPYFVKGATAVGVRLLLELIRRRIAKKS